MFLQGEAVTTWGANQGAQKSNRRNRCAETQITIYEIIKSGATLEQLFSVSKLTDKGMIEHSENNSVLSMWANLKSAN